MTGKKRSFAFLIVVALLSSFELGPLLAGESISFEDPIDYSVGRSPRSVTVGDFRRNGIQDLAVANFDSNNVSILLGDGKGGFQSVDTLVVGRNPYFVTVGDFNGDGKPDLAVANSGSNDVSIGIGHGNGTFELVPMSFPVGQSPRSIAVSDFDGDGIPDLAVANQASNNLSILLGNGDGTFRSGETYGFGGGASFVIAGDFDGDDIQDLAVTTLGASPFRLPGSVSILIGNGDGSFRRTQNVAVRANPLSLAAWDLDGDGVLDLAVANTASSTVSILLGNGDGTFQTAQNYPMGGLPRSLAVVDLNLDGIPDVVTADGLSTVSVLQGNGDGTFQPTRNFWAGADPVSLTVADFDGDDLQDVAVAQLYSNQVSVLFNNTPQPDDGVTIIRDIVFCEGLYCNPERQNLDIYLPIQGQRFPVVFLVYGGAFFRGDKSELGYLARTLARVGLQVVTPNHRLTDGSSEQVVHPGHQVDIARAFAWVYDHIAEYGGDRDKIVIVGHSSGANLVSLMATDPHYLADEGLSPELIKGVISLSGYYDMRDRGDLADTFGDRGQRWDASPLKYVSGREPPFQLLNGGAEPSDRITQAEIFYEALIQARTETEVLVIPDRDHNGLISRTARPGDPVREAMLRFIAEHTLAKP